MQHVFSVDPEYSSCSPKISFLSLYPLSQVFPTQDNSQGQFYQPCPLKKQFQAEKLFEIFSLQVAFSRHLCFHVFSTFVTVRNLQNHFINFSLYFLDLVSILFLCLSLCFRNFNFHLLENQALTLFPVTCASYQILLKELNVMFTRMELIGCKWMKIQFQMFSRSEIFSFSY